MILERLLVENFRPYLGRTEIEFAAPGKKNVTVVRGLNGTGKSSLFMALKWCFFGDAPVQQRNLACTAALRAAQPRETVETRVEVTYSNEGRRYKAIRSFKTRVGEPLENGEPTYAPEPTSELQLYEISAGGDAKPVDAVFDEIRSAVPREAVDYFFFDAEQIGSFADDSSGVSIRAAIREVLRFVVLEHAVRHVDAARQEYAKKLKQVAGADSAALVQRREELNQAVVKLRDQIGALDTELAAGQRVRDTYMTQLKELASISKLAEEKADLEGRKAQTERTREEALDAIATGLTSFALTLGAGALASAKELVDTKRRKGEIPSKVKVQVLQDWLAAERCICGRPLTPGSDEYHVVEHELQVSMPSRLEEELVSLGGNIEASRREGVRQEQSARLALSHLNQAREMAIAIVDRLNEIDRELRDQPIQDVSEIAARIKQQDREIEDRKVQRAEAAKDLVTHQADIDRLSLEIAKAEQHNKQATRVGLRHDLAARTVEALRDLKESFEEDVRVQVETEASNLFRELIWKSEHYTAVTLSPDFRLEAVDKWGEPAFSTGGTSMGEARVLSIAFIVAMQVVARKSLDTRSPSVIDSPFANLSIEPIRHICQSLPQLVDQVVLFLTEVDWRSGGEVLKDKLGMFYEVVFDEATSTASVTEAAS